MVTCSVTLTLVVAGRKASGAPQGPPQRHLPLHRSTARKARKENKEADSNQTWSDANIWFLKCNINMSYCWIQSYNAAHFLFFNIYNIEIYIYIYALHASHHHVLHRSKQKENSYENSEVKNKDIFLESWAGKTAKAGVQPLQKCCSLLSFVY